MKPVWEGLSPKDAFELGVAFGRAAAAMEAAAMVAKRHPRKNQEANR